MYMNELLPIHLTAEFSLSSSCCDVININQLNDYIWIQLPKDESNVLSLVAIYNSDDKSLVEFDIATCVRRGYRPWLRLDVNLLDLSVGYHKYVIECVNRYTNDVILLYFHYHIQDTNVNKPYVYMKRSEQ